MAQLDDRLFYYYRNAELLGVRKGKWKFVFDHKGNGVTEPGKGGANGQSDWEIIFPESLYDLEKDIDESNNLIDQYPEIATELQEAGKAFEASVKKEARPVGVDATYVGN
jgi:hypothetical protein